MATDSELIQSEIQKRSGWQVVSQSDSSVQLKRPRQISWGLIIIGLVLLPVGGVGIIVLILAIIDYASRKEHLVYITADQIRSGNAPKGGPSVWSNPVVVGGLLFALAIAGIVLCLGGLYALQWVMGQ